MNKFTAEEVWAFIHEFTTSAYPREDIDLVRVEQMLNAYAERIEVDESAVVVAHRFLGPDGDPVTEWDEGMPDHGKVFPSLCPPVASVQYAYGRPPAQAAQVGAVKALARLARHADDCLSHNVLPTGSGNWHCDCGYDRYVLDGEPTEAVFGHAAEPVAQSTTNLPETDSKLVIETMACVEDNSSLYRRAAGYLSMMLSLARDQLHADEAATVQTLIGEIQSAQPRAVPDGWVMVPREPTVEMKNAAEGFNYSYDLDDAWHLMISAAPQLKVKS